ncbi:hypothetical protein E2C01_020864 [Portunus trituberculatus]|uniref:Uncharacterized protein n=1 Tax=Portunus trituberculatus TaxID=210409 RepID=A0A5B7E2P3_PORTR|nr:hypothetical protein [Portunus trituberculatus]
MISLTLCFVVYGAFFGRDVLVEHPPGTGGQMAVLVQMERNSQHRGGPFGSDSPTRVEKHRKPFVHQIFLITRKGEPERHNGAAYKLVPYFP